MARITNEYMKALEVNFQSEGSVKHTYSSFVIPLLKKLSTKHLDATEEDELATAYKIPIVPTPIERMTFPGKVIEKLGRTLIVQQEGQKELDAYKFCKPGESIAEFTGEAKVTEFMSREGFESIFHQPQGLYYVGGIPTEIEDMDFPRINKNTRCVYHYRAPPEYFVYLHNKGLEENAWKLGRKRFLCDSTRQIRRGIHPFLADLYHNASKQRAYIPLFDTIKSKERPSATMGGGRLEAAFKAVEFPNARPVGGCDWRDAHILQDIALNPQTVSRDMRTLAQNSQDKRTFLQVNALSRVMLVDMLMLTYRWKEQEKLDWKDSKKNQELGQLLQDGFLVIFKEYADEWEEKCQQFLKGCGIDWEMMARQISFWVTNNDEGYLSWLNQNKIPDGIYPDYTKVNVFAEDAPNFQPHFGLANDKENLDIGIFNGPLALTEVEKAWTLICALSVGLAEDNEQQMHPKAAKKARTEDGERDKPFCPPV